MNKAALLGIGVCSLLVHSSASTATEAITLCDSSRQAIFSCHVGKKILSLCSSNPKAPGSAKLVYRFGKSRNNLELVFPKDSTDARKNFKFIRLGGGHWAGRQISFSIEPYTYTIMSYVDGLRKWQNSSGVAVSRINKVVAFRSCSHDKPDIDKLYLFENAGLAKAEYLSVHTKKHKN